MDLSATATGGAGEKQGEQTESTERYRKAKEAPAELERTAVGRKRDAVGRVIIIG